MTPRLAPLTSAFLLTLLVVTPAAAQTPVTAETGSDTAERYGEPDSADKAGDWEEHETLFSGEWTSGGYGGPVLRFGEINGQGALLVGGRGGWLINHSFLLGGGGFGLATRADSQLPGVEENRITFGYAGLMLEYLLFPAKAVHGSIGVLLGGGGAGVRGDDGTRAGHYSDAVWVYEPEVGVEFNMTEFFRINLGASYRIVTGVSELGALENKDFSSLNGSLMFKFGKF